MKLAISLSGMLLSADFIPISYNCSSVITQQVFLCKHINIIPEMAPVLLFPSTKGWSRIIPVIKYAATSKQSAFGKYLFAFFCLFTALSSLELSIIPWQPPKLCNVVSWIEITVSTHKIGIFTKIR